MRRFILMSLFVAPLAALPAAAQQYNPRPAVSYGVNLVSTWIHQYMGRDPNPADIAYGRMIDSGKRDPITELASILSSEEYYVNKGQGDDRTFLRALFADVLGRAPSPREEAFWVDRLSDDPTDGGRMAMAQAFLQQFPPELPPRPNERPDYRYRPPYRPEPIPNRPELIPR